MPIIPLQPDDPNAPPPMPVLSGPDPSVLSQFGSPMPQSPQSILGSKVASDAPISPKQMPEAKQAYFHDQERDLENVKSAQHGEMLRVLSNPYDPSWGEKIARLHRAQGDTRAEEARLKLDNPWGSESNHPGFLGKLGHAFGVLGASNPWIPGTRANLESKVAGGEAEAGLGEKSEQNIISGEAAIEKAEAAGARGEAAKTAAEAQGKKAETGAKAEGIKENELKNQLGTKIHDKLASGVPTEQVMQDPEVQALIGGIQATQKQPTPAHAQHVAGTVDGRPTFASYDPNTRKFLDAAGQEIPNFQPPPNFAQAGRFTPVEVATPGGGMAPGVFNQRTGTTTPTAPGTPAAIPHGAQIEVNKELETARNADRRLAIMEHNYERALKGDQQAMVSLVANHIGMTLGAQKGARINQAVWDEAIKSRPWLEGAKAKFDSRGYLSGVTLSRQQMDQMVSLAKEVRDTQWNQVNQAFGQYGIPSTGGAAANTPPRPTNVPSNYAFQENGPKGRGWYKPTEAK